MLAIDLLKGRGVPIKTRPVGASILAIIVAVPVVITIVTLGNYFRSGIELRNQRRVLANLQADIFKMTDSVRFKQNAEIQINEMNACFAEMGDTLAQQIQWSPVLQVLAENIPASLILSSLSIKLELKTKTVPDRRDPTKAVPVQTQKRILYISLYGRQMGGNDEAVLELLNALNTSEILGRKTDNIRLVAQATDNTKNVMNYVIECVFESL
ncbi:MAG: hypothetical protein ACYTFK_00275 [Planctomycetota bacterium]|jgi:Tfp pilus assembly protein PilN